MSIEWVVVNNSWTKKQIGAIGFIGNRIAVIAAFYEDKDHDQDGTVSIPEKLFSLFSMKGRAIAEVAAQARADPDILMRDPTLTATAGKLIQDFAFGAIKEGIYIIYFKAGISRASGAIAGQITSNAIASFVVKKGMEKAVKESYNAAMGI